MFLRNQNIITVIDIGGTKITSIMARVMSDGSFEILGMGNVASAGIENGVICDVKRLRSAIASSVYECEQGSGKHVDKVIISISHPSLKASIIKLVNRFGGRQVLHKDLKKITNTAIQQVPSSQYEILYHTVVNYDLDEMKGIEDPEFMFVSKLTSYVNIITVPVKYLINLSGCLLGCQLRISDFVISSYASALSCATAQDMNKGCIVFDIGGDVSDYTLIKNNKIIDVGVVQLGGKSITRDISNYFSISFAEAEKIKVLHGNLSGAADEDTYILVPGEDGKEDIRIDRNLLNKVIKARFFEIIKIFIEKAKLNSVSDIYRKNIIFTGGSSQFIGLEEFIKDRFKLNISYRKPANIGMRTEVALGAEFSTACGLIKSSLQTDSPLNHQGYSLKRAISWLKQNF